MTQTDLSSRSCADIVRNVENFLRTCPQFSRRSFPSFCLPRQGGKAMASARREDEYSLQHQVTSLRFWTMLVPCSEVSGRNLRSSTWVRCGALHTRSRAKHFCWFDLYFPEHNLPAGGTVRVGVVLTVMLACWMWRVAFRRRGGRPVKTCASNGFKDKEAACCGGNT